MNLIDTHAHLYQPAFDNDRDAMMQRAMAAGINRFYLPAIDSEVTDRMLQLEAAYPDQCFAMMGLHPCSVKEDWQQELAMAEGWLSRRPFVAVGEIGLDFYWDRTHEQQQYEAFRIQIEWALRYDLPIVIHTRNAMQPTIDVVREYKGRGLRGIFHCFSGSYESAVQILDAGFLLGIGGVVTYKNAGLPAVLSRLPVDSIVLETDAPYLSPVPFRGKRNESSYITYVLAEAARAFGISEAELADITTARALHLFHPEVKR